MHNPQQAASRCRGSVTLRCWGRDDSAEAEPPTGAFAEVAAENQFFCALTQSGKAVKSWGTTGTPKDNPPKWAIHVIRARLPAGLRGPRRPSLELLVTLALQRQSDSAFRNSCGQGCFHLRLAGDWTFVLLGCALDRGVLMLVRASIPFNWGTMRSQTTLPSMHCDYQPISLKHHFNGRPQLRFTSLVAQLELGRIAERLRGFVRSQYHLMG